MTAIKIVDKLIVLNVILATILFIILVGIQIGKYVAYQNDRIVELESRPTTTDQERVTSAMRDMELLARICRLEKNLDNCIFEYTK